jgi:hypothetical protein
MKELRFDADLYSGFAIDGALEIYAEFANFERELSAGQYVVRLTAKADHDEQQIADELANYALGATIEERRRPDAMGG